MISISILIATACFLYFYFTRTFSYWKNKDVVGPKPIPFFGNLIESALRRKHVGIVYKNIYDKFPNESVIGIYRMTNPALIIRDLHIAKQILIKDFDAFSERGIEFSKEGLGDNLFHCDSETWKALRNRLTPMFTSGKLRNVFPLIHNHADELVYYLEAVTAKGQEQEMHRILKKYTMGSILSASIGLNVDLFYGEPGIIEEAGHYIFRSSYGAELDMLFPNIFKKIDSSFYPDLVNKFCYDVVHNAMNQEKGIPTMQHGLLDTLLNLKKESELETPEKLNGKKIKLDITDHVMAGQVFIFFGAGFGNNALSLCYTLFQLARNQDTQDKLIQEIDEVLAKYDGKLTYDAIKEMTYLEKVFSEILRMNSLTNSIQRSAKRNYVVPGTDLTIEKGTTVLISPYAIHRDEQLYPDPDKFDPERFSPENIASRHPCAYIPFGLGPRSCIGRQLGKLQYFVAVVKIFSKFRVEPSEKTKKIEDYEPMNTLLVTRGGIYVKVLPRKM